MEREDLDAAIAAAIPAIAVAVWTQNVSDRPANVLLNAATINAEEANRGVKDLPVNIWITPITDDTDAGRANALLAQAAAHNCCDCCTTPNQLGSLNWRIGPVTHKTASPPPTPTPQSESHAESLAESEFTVQLTADQQVALSISGEDKYDNPVPVTGDVAWWSSDEAIVQVFRNVDDNTKAIAVAVGPVGTAAITVSNDFNQDGTGDFQGSLAIDVVAGDIAEIIVDEGEVSTKPAPDGGLPPTQPGTPDQGLPGSQPGPDNTLPGSQPGVDNTLPVPPGTEVSPPRPPRPDQGLPGSGARPDNSLPGSQPGVDNTLPGGPPARPDAGLPGTPDQGLPSNPPGVDNALPGDQPGIDAGLPGGPPARPGNELPGDQPGIDAGLPSGPPARPDQGLPDAPEPKGKRK